MTLENFIHQLNALAFFNEFTFGKTTFTPTGGSELELADNIVWMGDDLTVLQLKQRAGPDTGGQGNAVVRGQGTRHWRRTRPSLK